MTPNNETLPKAPKKYYASIIAIRGIAALIVALFHFTKGYMDDNYWLSYAIIHYGWIGVEIFFVVSGFVIPYSILGKPYRLKNYGEFMIKRIVRIHPAYLMSIGLVILLNYLSTLSPMYNGDPFSVSIKNLLSNVFYIVDFTSSSWLNPVYWTLAIEFQYYVIIGILLAFWNRGSKIIILITTILLLLTSLIHFEYVRFLKYTDIFVIGIIVAFYKKNYINGKMLLLCQLIVSVIILYNHGLSIATLVLICSIVIAFFSYSLKHTVFLFLGNISYSLYLVHIPVGGRLINLTKRLDLSPLLQSLCIIGALAISIVVSWLFYVYVEKPSHRWSRTLKLTKS